MIRMFFSFVLFFFFVGLILPNPACAHTYRKKEDSRNSDRAKFKSDVLEGLYFNYSKFPSFWNVADIPIDLPGAKSKLSGTQFHQFLVKTAKQNDLAKDSKATIDVYLKGIESNSLTVSQLMEVFLVPLPRSLVREGNSDSRLLANLPFGGNALVELALLRRSLEARLREEEKKK